MIVFPHTEEFTESFLLGCGEGRYVLLINVFVEGAKTSMRGNTTQNGAWRTRHSKAEKGNLVKRPNFELCKDTLGLSASDATELCKELPGIARLLPDKPIGNIKRTQS